VGVVRVTWAISTLWTYKISPQHVVGIQVISTTRPWSVCLWHIWHNASDSVASWLSAHVYYTLLPTKLHFMPSIWSGLVIQVVSALLRGNWQDFNWHDASRGPSAIAKLLVFNCNQHFANFETITVFQCCLIILLPYILFEKNIYILALEMASPGTSTVPIVSAHFRSLLIKDRPAYVERPRLDITAEYAALFAFLPRDALHPRY